MEKFVCTNNTLNCKRKKSIILQENKPFNDRQWPICITSYKAHQQLNSYSNLPTNKPAIIYAILLKIRVYTLHLAVEKLLSSSAGKYCVGDDITLADCCLVPQIFNARRFHVDLRPFPTILRVDRHLENHPAFTAAHPNNQPDCPPEATK